MTVLTPDTRPFSASTAALHAIPPAASRDEDRKMSAASHVCRNILLSYDVLSVVKTEAIKQARKVVLPFGADGSISIADVKTAAELLIAQILGCHSPGD